MFTPGMTTPANGDVNWRDRWNRLTYRLQLVAEKLAANPHVRDFSIIPPVYLLPSPSGSLTPIFPNPMIPLQYWRMWAKFKREQYISMISLNSGTLEIDDRRSLIDDAHYWRCEAMFWLSKSQPEESKRREIPDPNYWRCEAEFWKNAWISKQENADRFDIQHLEYWKCECAFWRSSIPELCDTDRYEIDNPKYWERENMHYNDILEAAMYADQPDDCGRAASPCAGSQVKYVYRCYSKYYLSADSQQPNYEANSASKRPTYAERCSKVLRPPTCLVATTKSAACKET
ncbi:hypothetical protein FQN50_008228 [Emmonsiellopsis sp. PD_5]|nr:hypothetical protein FQN50_008228 [Emmonsiellopsis sp. PD_5]